MKLIVSLFCTLLFSLSLWSQTEAEDARRFFSEKEDSLLRLSEKIIDGASLSERVSADSFFTKVLVRSLVHRRSFLYPFDSLYTISRLYAPDSSFRIITWQIRINDFMYRQQGAIQLNTGEGPLKLFPLVDRSELTINVEDTISDHFGWMGAVYYKIILKEHRGKKYYTLLGFDENDNRTNRKFIEILDMSGEKPAFGSMIFTKYKCARFVHEFKKGSGARLNYDNDLDMIIFEHLVSESGEPQKKSTLVGDGDYEGFKWEKGSWVYIPKVFDYVTPENKAPVPAPMKENKLEWTLEDEKPVKKKGKRSG